MVSQNELILSLDQSGSFTTAHYLCQILHVGLNATSLVFDKENAVGGYAEQMVDDVISQAVMSRERRNRRHSCHVPVCLNNSVNVSESSRFGLHTITDPNTRLNKPFSVAKRLNETCL